MADENPKKKKAKKTTKRATKNSDKTTKKATTKRKVKGADTDPRLANLVPFAPGQSGNPEGRPKGARDRRTVIWEAMKVLAENAQHIKLKGYNITTPEDVEVAMQMSALIKAIKRGDYHMYQELSNGLYGKITDNMDIKSGGKSLADLLILANNDGRTRHRTKTAKKD